jgi:hypothetical protein
LRINGYLLQKKKKKKKGKKIYDNRVGKNSINLIISRKINIKQRGASVMETSIVAQKIHANVHRVELLLDELSVPPDVRVQCKSIFF